jgi:hypothetical protein
MRFKVRNDWYISTTIEFLYIINYPAFLFKTKFRRLDSCAWHFVMFVFTPADSLCCVWFICPALCWFQCSEIGTSSIDWAQLSKFYLKTETEPSVRNDVFWKIRTMDNVKIVNNSIQECFMEANWQDRNCNITKKNGSQLAQLIYRHENNHWGEYGGENEAVTVSACV